MRCRSTGDVEWGTDGTFRLTGVEDVRVGLDEERFVRDERARFNALFGTFFARYFFVIVVRYVSPV